MRSHRTNVNHSHGIPELLNVLPFLNHSCNAKRNTYACFLGVGSGTALKLAMAAASDHLVNGAFDVVTCVKEQAKEYSQ
jgi:hypothetical protein